jgi:outer membrane protein assembly factor BamB
MLKRERCITLKEVKILTGKGALSSALVVMICVGAFVHLNISSDNGVSAQEVTKGEFFPWAIFRSDLNNTGVSDSGVPENNKTFMEFYAGGPIYSSAVYHDKNIYFGSDTNRVHAVEVSTGLELWNNTTGGAVQATPLIIDDVLFVGSNDDSMYAFNVSTGEQLWSFPTGGDVVSSAKYYDGNIYFGSQGEFNLSSFTFDGKLFAVNASTGVEEWNFTAKDQVWSSPSINDGLVYFGALDGNMYSVWANNGTLNWNYSSGAAGEDFYSSPALQNGRVFVGTSYQMTQLGALIALNASTGALEWEFATGGFVYSSPAVHDEMVFFGTAEEPWNGDKRQRDNRRERDNVDCHKP